MTQRLHLVFGGELVDPTRNVVRDVEKIDIVGMFPDYASAYTAWKGAAHGRHHQYRFRKTKNRPGRVPRRWLLSE